ncbi:ribosome biogenesis GTPase [Sinobacterium caligoides]|uniref:Small ribosomal subunit biogenesis GTPase RsgA n=1 Tax=Sinobacterium caligoides TaxID=933926 RepID=A0A3N2DG34_9GAMM|nr:small ribosomal subunit biogenesis GTPase RsgA [Sinobacterium caligoides]ROR98765.1 ribosome biogenesis GTPase [Sinobacterium caligoides]
MAKRKLNRRQKWRIEKVQDERNKRSLRRAAVAEEQLDEGQLGAEQKGLITAHFGTQVEVEITEGESAGERRRAHLRANLPALVTGDLVAWRPGNPTGVVVACHDRRSELCRPNNRGELRPVAANVDYIVIVVAPFPTPYANLIDRYLVASEHSRITPILALNKTDLVDDNNRQQLEELLAIYPQIGYRLVYTSAKSANGLDELKQILGGSTCVFVGQSGVGKSSLINALLPGMNIPVGGLSESTQKGKHTTTTAKLFHFPSGGDLIDSPGIREFGLWHMNEDDIAEGFSDIRPFIGHCRFRDCKHQSEPQCALLDAVARGDISQRRMDSFRHLVASLEML